MKQSRKLTQEKAGVPDKKSSKQQERNTTSPEQVHASGEYNLQVADTPFQPPLDYHTALLSHAKSESRQASLVLQLQRTYGNAYVQRLINTLGIHAKLTISNPDDMYEKEADHVAEMVTRTPELQRTASPEEEEDLVQGKLHRVMTSEGDEVQAKADAAVPEATDNIEKRINAQTGGGQALDEVTQTFFESGLGYDFSQVRVHTDAEANSLSRELSAEAFTTGNDIFFREGAYQPNTDEGKKLVAHELTHVVQQNAIPAIQRALSDVLDSDRIDIDYLIELDAFEDALNSLRDAIGALDMPELSNEKCSSNPLRYSASQSQQGITWYDTTEGGWDQRTNTMTGIYIELGPQAFKSTEFLYNTMMHEYQHMLQFIRNPNEWMVANRHGLWEFEAYYWEITHLSETEITDAAEIADMGRRLTTEGWNRMNQQEKTDHQAEYDNAINIIRGILGDPAWTP